jgi:predicted GIY-YIG superfamily endonuclease
MGCTTSSTKISAEPSNTGGSDPTSKQPPTELLIDKKKKDKKNSIEEEAKLRRSVQGKTENMVREEFDRGQWISDSHLPILILSHLCYIRYHTLL